MKFRAEIDIMPHKALLDPQGKAVTSGLKNLGFTEIDDVRIGKHITMSIEASSEAIASKKVEDACRKLLANEIMEGFSFHIFEEK